MGQKDEPPKFLEQERLSDDFFTDAFENEGGGRVHPKDAEKFFHEQIGDVNEGPGGGGGSQTGVDATEERGEAEPADRTTAPGSEDEVPTGEQREHGSSETPDGAGPDQPIPDESTREQPSPDQPSPGQPSPDQPSPDQPNPDQPSPGGDPFPVRDKDESPVFLPPG